MLSNALGSISNFKTAIPNDFGLYMDDPGLSSNSERRYTFLTNHWVPDQHYKFPVKKEGACNTNRSVQLNWLQRRSWLVYSELKQGLYCKFYALFAPASVRNQQLETFVSQPLQQYRKVMEKCTSHENTKYHRDSLVAADCFLKQRSSPLKKSQINCPRVVYGKLKKTGCD